MLYTFFMNSNNNSIAANISAFRKSLGLTQQELATKCELTQRAIAYYESGKHDIPHKNIIKIANALNISIADILESDHKKNSAVDNIDVRWFKKIQEIKTLPLHEQKSIVKYINLVLEKHKKQAS
jgi:transcriptional regulator with XRE-family HTH domain